jgi:cell division protein FtsB
MQRAVTWTLFTILVVLQGQLWIGRGSLPEVWRLQQQLSQQSHLNGLAMITNQRLNAELLDLKTGLEMVEERARKEIGMVRNNEIFVQLGNNRPLTLTPSLGDPTQCCQPRAASCWGNAAPQCT